MKTQVATAGTQTELSSLNSRTIPMSAYDAVVKKWDEEKMKVKDITTLYEQSKVKQRAGLVVRSTTVFS
jgi:hypothetical protein